MQASSAAFSRRKWQERHFALRGTYLKYFPDTRKTEIKGVLDMRLLQTVERDDDEYDGAIGLLLEFTEG
jgi:hypothetical protein